MSETKAMDLFDAYSKSMLPKEHGYIVSSFFHPTIAYARYEIVSYNNVKSIYPSEDGLTFQTDGKKLYILVEPPSYAHKSVEPYVRSSDEQIPLRFNELDDHTCKNQTSIYIAKQAVVSYGSFTIMRPSGMNFTFVFFDRPDIGESMRMFFEKTINRECQVPLSDAKQASAEIVGKVNKLMVGDYS
jgi:hypothetical protein